MIIEENRIIDLRVNDLHNTITWTDQSGNNNNFSIFGSVGLSTSGALKLDSSTKYLDRAQIDFGDVFTVEQVIKVNELDGTVVLFRQGATPGFNIGYGVIDGVGKVFSTIVKDGVQQDLLYDFGIEPSKYYHLVLTYNFTDKEATLYVNGSAVSTLTIDSSINGYYSETDNEKIWLGRNGDDGSGRHLNNRYDLYQFRIYDRELTATEVTNNFNEVWFDCEKANLTGFAVSITGEVTLPTASVGELVIPDPLPNFSTSTETEVKTLSFDVLSPIGQIPDDINCEQSYTQLANRKPTAYAGGDLTISTTLEKARVNLLGRGEDPDGDNLNFHWSSSDATILNPNTQNISLSLAEGVYSFTLRVTDPSGESHEDTTTVTITRSLITNSLFNNEIFTFGTGHIATIEVNKLKYTLQPDENGQFYFNAKNVIRVIGNEEQFNDLTPLNSEVTIDPTLLKTINYTIKVNGEIIQQNAISYLKSALQVEDDQITDLTVLHPTKIIYYNPGDDFAVYSKERQTVAGIELEAGVNRIKIDEATTFPNIEFTKQKETEHRFKWFSRSGSFVYLSCNCKNTKSILTRSFGSVESDLLPISKTTSRGFIIGKSTETATTYNVEILNESDYKLIEDLISSPKVWIKGKLNWLEVEILTSRIAYDNNNLKVVSIQFRELNKYNAVL